MISMRMANRPKHVHVAFETPAAVKTTYTADRDGRLAICVPHVHIHAAVVVEMV